MRRCATWPSAEVHIAPSAVPLALGPGPQDTNLCYYSSSRGLGCLWSCHRRPHRAAPIGQVLRKRYAHIAGYYVLVYADTRGRTGGLAPCQERRPRYGDVLI